MHIYQGTFTNKRGLSLTGFHVFTTPDPTRFGWVGVYPSMTRAQEELRQLKAPPKMPRLKLSDELALELWEDTGGFSYWCRAAIRRHDTKVLHLTDDEGADHAVTVADIKRAVALVLSPGFRVRRGIRNDLLQAIQEKDPGYIDYDVGDVLIQAACFGEIVYG